MLAQATVHSLGDQDLARVRFPPLLVALPDQSGGMSASRLSMAVSRSSML
jgi:hypothetical protein